MAGAEPQTCKAEPNDSGGEARGGLRSEEDSEQVRAASFFEIRKNATNRLQQTRL